MDLRSPTGAIRSNCRIKHFIKLVCDIIRSAISEFVLAKRINIFMQLKWVVLSNSIELKI